MGKDVEGNGRSLIQGTDWAHEYHKNRQLYPSFFPDSPCNCVRAVFGDCKPSDSFQKAHVIDRKTRFCSGRWTVSNRFLLSTVFPFAIYVHISALPHLYSYLVFLQVSFMPCSTHFFYPFFVTCPNIFLSYQRIFRIQFYLKTCFLTKNIVYYTYSRTQLYFI